MRFKSYFFLPLKSSILVYIDKKVATKHFQTSIFILTQHVCFKFLGYWMYLVARMELLARFLLHGAAPCFLLLWFSPWISRAKGSSCIWSVLYKCNLIPSHWRKQAQFFLHYLTIFVNYTWDPEFTTSTQTIFWGSWGLFHWSSQDLSSKILPSPGRAPKRPGEWPWNPYEQEKNSIFQTKLIIQLEKGKRNMYQLL